MVIIYSDIKKSLNNSIIDLKVKIRLLATDGCRKLKNKTIGNNSTNILKNISLRYKKTKIFYYFSNQFSGDNRAVAPPDSISNSEVKRSIADGSVGSPM